MILSLFERFDFLEVPVIYFNACGWASRESGSRNNDRRSASQGSRLCDGRAHPAAEASHPSGRPARGISIQHEFGPQPADFGAGFFCACNWAGDFAAEIPGGAGSSPQHGFRPAAPESVPCERAIPAGVNRTGCLVSLRRACVTWSEAARCVGVGCRGRIRTCDLVINSHALYQLNYPANTGREERGRSHAPVVP